MLLIKNAKVYAPEYVGKKDLLVCGGKIECMEDKIEDFPIACEVIDAEERILTPGFIDQHVHVTGGGGEGSFHTRTPELQLSELVKGGITTVVGLLGTDGLTRSVENLYAKVQALCEEGVSAYMLTGAYGYPSPTITGEVDRDIMFVEKVLGVKLAISDHRAPNVTESELIQLASKTRTAGMLSGKPGIVVQHKNEDQEIQALDRIIQQNQNGTRNSTDIRSEERNDIGHTNDYTDQKYVRHLQELKSKEAKHSDNHRINDLSNNKSTENLIAFLCQMQDHIGMICTEHCIDDLFTLCGKCFLTEQNID